jgi:hypothetical protein
MDSPGNGPYFFSCDATLPDIVSTEVAMKRFSVISLGLTTVCCFTLMSTGKCADVVYKKKMITQVQEHCLPGVLCKSLL